jgi:hypothetical protein
MSAASLLCCLTGSGPSARRPDARGASADAPATRHVQCRDIIVHPQFVQTLSFPPVEFCPMDWLPDEVITNVLVHVVRGLATTRRASVRATRRDGAGVGGPCRILAPKALTPARVFSTSVPLADRLADRRPLISPRRLASTRRVSPPSVVARGVWRRTTRCGASFSSAGSGSRSRRTSHLPRARAGGGACTGTTRRRWIASCGAKRATRETRFLRLDSQTSARDASGRCTCSTAARYSSAREHAPSERSMYVECRVCIFVVTW